MFYNLSAENTVKLKLKKKQIEIVTNIAFAVLQMYGNKRTK